MCGLAGMVARRAGCSAEPRADRRGGEGAPPPRPRRLRKLRHRGRRARAHSVEHRRRRGGRAAASQRGRLGRDRLQRRDLELPRAATRARASRTPVRDALRHRGARPRLRGVGRRPRPARLNGMFAFAIWDERRERLCSSRATASGKKPLYVARTADGVAFGSDARSVLLAGGVRPALDEEHVAEFLFQRYVSLAANARSAASRSFRPDIVLDVRPASAPTVRRVLAARVRTEPEPLDATASCATLLRDSARRAPDERRAPRSPPERRRRLDRRPRPLREAGAGRLATFTVGFDDPLYDERAARARVQRSDTAPTTTSSSWSTPDFPRRAAHASRGIATSRSPSPRRSRCLLLAEFAGST